MGQKIHPLGFRIGISNVSYLNFLIKKKNLSIFRYNCIFFDFYIATGCQGINVLQGIFVWNTFLF